MRSAEAGGHGIDATPPAWDQAPHGDPAPHRPHGANRQLYVLELQPIDLKRGKGQEKEEKEKEQEEKTRERKKLTRNDPPERSNRPHGTVHGEP